ncbi:MAG: class I SAM-dependent RNA methyltransferase [Alphaproteobacteria bacterium]|nr:MAG: class I SAM-dependent RNA methyltransferase [Alphaproteobacteria bacterium]
MDDASRSLSIVRLGSLGDGIAADGTVVPGALPGEDVSGKIRDGRLERPRILKASAHRVRPPCPHHADCGGCALQHARDGFVAAWKQDQVLKALKAQGMSAKVEAIHTSPVNARRRAVLSARRTRKGALVGFHARASGTVVEIADCVVMRPALLATLPSLQPAVRALASRRGELSVYLTETLSGVDVDIRGARALGLGERHLLAEVAEAQDLARISVEGEPVATRRQPLVRMGRALVPLPPGAFLQATAEGEAALVAFVREALSGCRQVADLFAGVGTFALPLAEDARVHALEGDRAAVEALAAARNGTEGLRQLDVARRDLFRQPLDEAELSAFDGVVIDPPRAGAAAQMRALATAGPARIASISCNPATFARDARILATGGYRLRRLVLVDQFRWSHHIEIAALFERA